MRLDLEIRLEMDSYDLTIDLNFSCISCYPTKNCEIWLGFISRLDLDLNDLRPDLDLSQMT